MYRRTSWIDCADLTARNDIDRVGEGLQLVVLDVPAELLDFQLADSVLLLLLLLRVRVRLASRGHSRVISKLFCTRLMENEQFKKDMERT